MSPLPSNTLRSCRYCTRWGVLMCKEWHEPKVSEIMVMHWTCFSWHRKSLGAVPLTRVLIVTLFWSRQNCQKHVENELINRPSFSLSGLGASETHPSWRHEGTQLAEALPQRNSRSKDRETDSVQRLSRLFEWLVLRKRTDVTQPGPHLDRIAPTACDWLKPAGRQS